MLAQLVEAALAADTNARFKDLLGAGGPLLRRAQEAGAVRTDVDVSDVIHLVSGIAKLSTLDPEQVRHVLDVAIDGLRSRSE